MIRAEFFADRDGLLTGYHISGHSGFAESGQDIICAFVSSAAYMTANTITDVMGIDAEAQVSDGDMRFMVAKKDAARCRDALEGLRLHLLSTEEQYPEFLKVINTEVQCNA